LVAFTFVSCSNPLVSSGNTGSGTGSGNPAIVITPGEGNPRYVYIDSNGKITDVDQGRTALFVENNKNANGVLIVSDKVDSGDRVSISNQNNNSIVSMFFRPGSNFPYYMVINVNGDIYYAHLSSYNPATSMYDIVFANGGEYEPLFNLVFNKDIFNAYEDDPDLNSSQNLRLRNITIALGLWGSLYNSFDTQDISPMAARGILKFFVRVVKSVFIAVAVIATVVAIVVAPIVTFINPAAGVVVMKAAQLVAAASTAIVMGLTKVEQWLDDKKTNPPPSKPYEQNDPDRPKTAMLFVKNVYEDKKIENGVEFHIGRGKDVQLEFSISGWDTTSTDKFYNYFLHVDYLNYGCVSENSGDLRNSMFFDLSLVKDDQKPDIFLVKIKRTSDDSGYLGDGKIAYVFEYFGADEIVVNGEDKEFNYKYFWENEMRYDRKNVVVVWFCVKSTCPDYMD
jgi:hypothetical protein